MKDFTQKFFALALFLLASAAASAQTPFWTEDFTGGIPATWSNADPSGNNALWTWCSNPANATTEPGCPMIWDDAGNNQVPFASTSASTGFATLDSDAYAQLTTDHVSELATPAIDLSTYGEVWLRFETHIGVFTLDAEANALLRVSKDGGVTWTNFTLFPGLTTTVRWSGNPEVKVVDISSVAANQSNVLIQWQWTGNYEYNWNLDDIALYDEEPVAPADPNLIWGGPTDPAGSFEGGLTANGWMVNAVSDTDAVWVWDAEGDAAGGAYWGTRQPIISPSVANGAAMFNSDFFDNAGIVGNFGLGVAAAPQFSELISPTIDLTGNPFVSLQFNQYYRNFQSETSVAYSNDGGVSWSDPVVLNADIATNAETTRDDVQTVPLFGAGGTNQFKVKFIFDANYYFWIVDDVSIIKRAGYELALGDFFFPPASYAQPVTQIDIDTMGFSVDLSNLGSDEQAGITLHVEVTDGATVLFEDELVVPALAPETNDSTFAFPNQFVPNNLGVGIYSINYSIVTDSIDFNPDNNFQSELFEVTDDLFSKEDGNPDNEVAFQPGGGGEWMAGNFYRTSPNWVDGYKVDELVFSAATNDSLAGKNVTLYILEVSDAVDANFDNFDDMMLDPLTHPQLVPIGLGEYAFPSGAQDFSLQAVPMEDVLGSADGVPLSPGKRYFALVKYANEPIFQTFSTGIEYFQVSTLVVSTQWFLGGFGPENAALIRMPLSLFNKADETPLPDHSLTFFPNPASGKLNVEISLEKPALANVTIADLNGKVILIDELPNARQETRQYDVSRLPAGMYLVRVATAEGTKTKQFAVQR